jgi:hypothetical protein
MNKETIETLVLLPNGHNLPAVFELDFGTQEDEIVSIKLSFANHKFISHGDTFWEALKKLRINLEKENILIVCYGSCLNVHPSPTILNMGEGRQAYRLTIGEQAKKKNLVDILGSDNDVQPTTVKKQEDYYSKWLISL